MRLIRRALVSAVVFMGSTGLAAQESAVTVTPLTEHLFLLSTDQGSYTTNTLAFVGSDGLLLVDTQSKADAPDLKEAVDALGAGAPRYIINTHRHVEHVGGNAIFGEDPIVIAHALVPDKLRSGSYIFDEFPPATYPDITVADSLTLRFNGETVRIVAIPGSHDDTEIFIHFVEEKVVHLSSVVNGFTFPSVDAAGSVLAFADRVERAMELLPEDVTIVSGHNDVGSWHDLRGYREMLLETERIIREGLGEGKDVATLQEENALEAFGSHPVSYVDLDAWIATLAAGIQGASPSPPSLYEPLFRVWKEEGAEAAVTRYFDLKRDHPEDYAFGAIVLVQAGRKVLDNGHLDAAEAFLEAALREDSDGQYTAYTLYTLARVYDLRGETEQAVEYCDRSLAVNPEYAAALSLRDRLTGASGSR